MSRHYVLGCWANADEYDYSGEQLMGNRHGKSVCMDHMLPSGMANLSRYGDPVQKTEQVKKKKSIADSIDLSNRHLERMERMSIELDEEYAAGKIDDERYTLLRYKMDERLVKAWNRVQKENVVVWTKQEEIDSIYEPQDYDRNNHQRKSFTDGVQCDNILINSLSQGNIFRQAYLMIIKLRGWFK